MLLAQANRLDNGEIVKGYFQRLTDGRMLICHVELVDDNSDDYLFGEVKYTSWHEVDISTLKYKIGNNFYTIEEITKYVKYFEPREITNE